ncbi:MAG: 5-(carboxyamino)imidazole ribonucleotide synthase [Roseiflexaceae bacterium]
MIGILGGGQLGRMLALAGYPLGLRFRVLEPAAGPPAAPLAEHHAAPYDNPAALERFATGLEAVTYEFENVPVQAARLLEGFAPVFPPPRALEVAQDRLSEKQCFQRLGIPTPPFAPVESRAELDAALAQIGLPAVLKTRRLGYDGKGQAVLRTPADVEPAWAALGGTPLILEGFVGFRRELSVLAVRGRDGATVCYPLVENEHRTGILRRSLAPAPALDPALQARAEDYAGRVLDELGYVGVLAIELFEVADGDGSALLANEMAPRVHNSGHWTIEGAETSQFENHLRAVLGLPLGSTAPRGHVAMLNLVGGIPEPAALLALPGVHLHLYDKEPRPRRKVGHVTVRANSAAELRALLERLEPLVERDGWKG